MNRPEQIREFILDNVESHPRDIAVLTAQKFGVTPPSAHWHINKLIRDGKLGKAGRTQAIQYFLANKKNALFEYQIGPSTSEEDAWNAQVKPLLLHLPTNVINICQYGFTEMFNNAIDHSEGKRIRGSVMLKNGKIELVVRDDGVGIFHKIQHTFQLTSTREAILHLTKGKITTDPKRHSGEGIFFTSRIFDEFTIVSGDMAFVCFDEDDWMMSRAETAMEKGTKIIMKLPINSKRSTREIFDRYTAANDQVTFSKTAVSVELSKNDDESHISRSQAKRILAGLEKFKEIVLDFRNVHTVGQGFVDEVFRVFQNEHPDIRIIPVDMNPDVEFMIKRSVEGISPTQQKLDL